MENGLKREEQRHTIVSPESYGLNQDSGSGDSRHSFKGHNKTDFAGEEDKQ